MLKLDDFQEYGAYWLSRHRVGLLADEMRVGKTPQVVHACDLVAANRILVMCPPTATYVWRNHFNDGSLYSLPVTVIDRQNTRLSETGINIVPYSRIANPAIRAQIFEFNPEVVVLDEAHALKSTGSQRTKSVFGSVRDNSPGLVQKAKYLWAVTGTPMPNDPSELYPFLRVSGRYKYSYDTFVKTFCTGYPGKHGFVITGSKNEEDLQDLLRPIMLRRLRKHVMKEIPPIINHFTVEPVIPDKEVFNTHFRKDNVKKAEDGAKFMAELLEKNLSDDELVEELNKSVDHVARLRMYTGMIKAKNTAKWIKQRFVEDDWYNCVVFAVSCDAIKILQQELKEYNPVTVWGGTPPHKRESHINKFSRGASRVFIGNIIVAGEAIDLSATNRIVFHECSWVPKDNEQAAARCSGRFQPEAVEIYFARLNNSIDDKVMSVYERKLKTISKILD